MASRTLARLSLSALRRASSVRTLGTASLRALAAGQSMGLRHQARVQTAVQLQQTVQLRMNSSAAPQRPPMDAAQATAIGETVLANLANPRMMYAAALQSIKDVQGLSLQERWQSMMQVYLSVLAQALLPYGFSGDLRGLQEFHLEMDQLMPKHPELVDLAKQRWQLLAEKAFGVKFEAKDEITLEQARAISSSLAVRMQSNDFLGKIDAAMAKLPASASDEDRQKQLLPEILSLQMENMKAYDFHGEDGFVKMQCALSMCETDDTIKYNTMSGMFVVFRRAGIDLQKMQGQ
eukprot:m.299422 g.299422  ORF g.299422 m.299422 type:complete len:292 (-) comp14132_c0_seq1:177-1052(-)